MHKSQDEKVVPAGSLTETNRFEHGLFVDLNEEIVRLQEDTAPKEEAGHRAKVLAKYPEFRVVLITMRAGSRWDDHKTNSRISVQLLRGHIQFHTPGRIFDLYAGQLFALDPGVLHSVDSLETSAFLLTLATAK